MYVNLIGQCNDLDPSAGFGIGSQPEIRGFRSCHESSPRDCGKANPCQLMNGDVQVQDLVDNRDRLGTIQQVQENYDPEWIRVVLEV